MASTTATRLPLDVSFYQNNIDADTIFCKTLLEALADGTKDAAEAAHDLDAWVTGESTRQLEELRSRPGVIEKTAYGTVSRANTPNASGYVEHFFKGFPSLGTIFAPHEAGQTRLIAFLEALMAIPLHQAPETFTNTTNLEEVESISLWPRGVIDPDTFRVHAAKIDCVGSGLEVLGSEAFLGWRNYQSALARITMTGFSDCSFLCGLRGILPKGKKYSLPTPKVQEGIRPADMGFRIQAAVQWLLEPDEACWVYVQCSKKEKTDKDNPRDTWSKENWVIWKAQLAFYRDNDLVEPSARDAARQALERMIEVEA
ncbi:hypothetical protein HBH98_071390 [Parastagonospora nodorum]|nr:hypothetical protein HBH53_020580 [Parastagonospora nodorum]KAH3968264.1 hypothetical protein HBH51_132860 [Parastagonospora nodorum]KAH3999905.1 hypothetical protein HBI10_106760 [Parastagonospora nodorum]KAH4022422.1 hypothetical protein HBI13_102430 [Parastagonospora nodorum]KAH4027569.1 hypothetical protein HBI09_140400 [Parastagonospora nodorum]